MRLAIGYGRPRCCSGAAPAARGPTCFDRPNGGNGLFANIIRGKTKRWAIVIAFEIAVFAMSGPLKAQTTNLMPPDNEQPSFDCSTAKTASARLICADLELTRLDRELGIAFQKQKRQVYLADQPRFVTDQLTWIRERNQRCGLAGKNHIATKILAGSKPCLMSAIQERIAFLDNVKPRASVDSNLAQPSQMAASPDARSSQSQPNWPDPQQAAKLPPWPGPASQQFEQQNVGYTKLEIAKQQGYRSISLDDFKLDGKQLSETNSKLILRGFYTKDDELEVLQESGLAVAIARRYGNTRGVPLLTDAATREVRKYFLRCASGPLIPVGCPITIIGHAEMCSANSLLETKSVPCLVVEDGW
jgi:uncharacterized protein